MPNQSEPSPDQIPDEQVDHTIKTLEWAIPFLTGEDRVEIQEFLDRLREARATGQPVRIR